MRTRATLFVFVAILVSGVITLAIIFHRKSPSLDTDSRLKAFSPDSYLFINASAKRIDDGRVVISGETNLPEGLKMWVTIEDGKHPLGTQEAVAPDDNVYVRNGHFSTSPFWLKVPNKLFTTEGWPAGVEVQERERPYPTKVFNVHFTSMFNSAWQTAAVLDAVGGEGGKTLRGQIIRAVNDDVVDSTKAVDYTLKVGFPPLSRAAQAISLVRAAVMSTPEGGRSTGDVQAVVDMYMVSPGLSPAKGWSAKEEAPDSYTVFFDFINGSQGEQQALWKVNLTSGKISYVNENGKLFSWAPSY